MIPFTGLDTQWRASGLYVPTLSSKAGLLSETRQFLQTLGQMGDLNATQQALVTHLLPQRSRATRTTIVRIIQQRLVRWFPPEWVIDDLVRFAQDTMQPSLAAALLVHVVRQDALLYDFVTTVIMPRWKSSDHLLVHADVQRFLDSMELIHPEILGWSHSTREKLAGNVLAILRDYGLCQGRVTKRMIEPDVPRAVAFHLLHLLRAEDVPADQLCTHPDWQIWLWEPQRVQQLIAQAESGKEGP